MSAAGGVVGRPVFRRRPDAPLNDPQQALGPFAETSKQSTGDGRLASGGSTRGIDAMLDYLHGRWLHQLPAFIDGAATFGAPVGDIVHLEEPHGILLPRTTCRKVPRLRLPDDARPGPHRIPAPGPASFDTMKKAQRFIVPFMAL